MKKIYYFSLILLFLICKQQIAAANSPRKEECSNPTTKTAQSNNKSSETDNQCDDEDLDEDEEDDFELLYQQSKNSDTKIQKHAFDRLISLVLIEEVTYEEIIKKGFIQVFIGYLENEEMKKEGLKGFFLLMDPKALPDLIKCLTIEDKEIQKTIKAIIGKMLSEHENIGHRIFASMDEILESVGKVAEEKVYSEEMSDTLSVLFAVIFLNDSLLSDQQMFNFYKILSKLFDKESYKRNHLIIQQTFLKSGGDRSKFEIISKSQIFKKLIPSIKDFPSNERDIIFSGLYFALSAFDVNKTKTLLDAGLLTNMKFFLQLNEVTEVVVEVIYQLILSLSQEDIFPLILEEVMDETLPQVAKLMKHEKEVIRNVAGKLMAFVATEYENKLFRKNFPEDFMKPFCNLLVSVNDSETIEDILNGIVAICEYHLTNYKELKLIDKKCWNNIKFYGSDKNEKIRKLATEIIDKYYRKF